MPTNSSLDLQRFYPDELEIVSIEEDSDEIRLHMRSRSKSFCGYSCAGVPLFRRNGYRQSSGRKPLFRNRDTALN